MQPDMIRIFRHAHAIPQYEQSSGSRFETIDELQARYPGLTLAGNIKSGIGMADRIRQATEIADKLIKRVNHHLHYTTHINMEDKIVEIAPFL